MRSRAVLLSVAATLTATAAAFAPSPRAFRRCPALSAEDATTTSETTTENTVEGMTISGEFVPVNNMILILPPDSVDTTEGGIFLTGKSKIQKSEGLVVSAGPGRINLETGYVSEMPVGVGERVSYGRYDGTEVMYNDVRHNLIRDDDVLLKFPAGSDPDSDSIDGVEVLWDSVLVKLPAREDGSSTESGILLARTTKKSSRGSRSTVGDVIKVGPGRNAYNGVLMEMDVEVGDKIKFRDFAAQDVEVGGEDYCVVRMTDILAKF